MAASDGSVHGFRPGDVAWCTRRFDLGDFEAFAAASGDRNPMHHDDPYCAATPFGRPIVPLMLGMAPVSALVGMVLPGRGAVIADAAFRPLRPIAYDAETAYSLRVESVNVPASLLTLRLLVTQGPEVVCDGTLHVKATADSAVLPLDPARLERADEPAWALVTGAAGTIGAAVTRELATRGCNLLLHGRAADARLDELAGWCRQRSVAAEVVTGDLAEPEQLRLVAQRAGDLRPAVLVHAAGAPLDAPAADQVAVGYTAFRVLTDAVLPAMLRRQRGHVVLLGSQASRYHPPGWDDYVAAKAAAASVVAGVEHRYGHYGIRGLSVNPGYVDGPYSAGVRPPEALALLPEEVADALVDEIARPGDGATALWLEPGRRERTAGARQVTTQRGSGPDERAAEDGRRPAGEEPAGAEAVESRVAEAVRGVLRLPAGADLRGAALGVTPGWESLSQLEILLAVEAGCGVRFSAEELSDTTSFDRLQDLVRRKLREG